MMRLTALTATSIVAMASMAQADYDFKDLLAIDVEYPVSYHVVEFDACASPGTTSARCKITWEGITPPTDCYTRCEQEDGVDYWATFVYYAAADDWEAGIRQTTSKDVYNFSTIFSSAFNSFACNHSTQYSVCDTEPGSYMSSSSYSASKGSGGYADFGAC